MPIREELRHLYRGPAWRAIRERILARADNRCERCRKPNRRPLSVTSGGIWFDEQQNAWCNDQGEPNSFCYPGITGREVYVIYCVLTIAHLDHNPHNNADDNLLALCQHCHLKHDQHFHYANARRKKAQKAGQQWLTEEIEKGVCP